MSKAFTRESDEAPESPIRPRPRPVSLSGMKNYLTEDGAETLRAELSQLLQEIPSSPGEPRRLEKSRPGMSKRDERIAQIQEILRACLKSR